MTNINLGKGQKRPPKHFKKGKNNIAKGCQGVLSPYMDARVGHQVESQLK